MSATVRVTSEAGVRQSAGDQVRTEIQTQIRQAIREATNDARVARVGQEQAARDAAEAARGAAEAARDAARAAVEQGSGSLLGGMQVPREVIDVLNAQIAAEKQAIEALTNQLTNQTSPARERVLTEQISSAQERLTALQEQLDRALGVAEFSADASPPPPFEFNNDNAIPPDVLNIIITFFVSVVLIAIGLPIARAWARRLDRKGEVAVANAAASQNADPRLERIEQAVEAIAIEVERVSEGQRYTNKLMHEMRALPAPNPLDQWPKQGEKQGDKAAVRRGE